MPITVDGDARSAMLDPRWRCRARTVITYIARVLLLAIRVDYLYCCNRPVIDFFTVSMQQRPTSKHAGKQHTRHANDTFTVLLSTPHIRRQQKRIICCNTLQMTSLIRLYSTYSFLELLYTL